MSRTIQLLQLVGACKRIEGRKKLQKMVHILQSAGYTFEYPFSLHYHGPFSFELKAELDALCAEGIVREQHTVASGNDFPQYDFQPGEKLPEILSRVGADDSPAWAAAARELNGKPSHELEAISTLLFLKDRGFQDERLQQRFAELKPRLASKFESANAAADRFVSLRHQQTA